MTAYIQLIVAMVIYGSVGIFVRQIDMTSVNIVLTRTFLGGLLILATILLKREEVDLEVLKENFWILLASGASMGLSWILLFEAYSYTTVSLATLAYYLAPVMLLILSPLVLKENLTINKVVGITAAGLGMIMVNGGVRGGLNPKKGLIIGLMSAFFYTIMMLLNKFLKEGLSGLVITFMQLGSAFFTILFYIIFISKEAYVLAEGIDLFYLFILCSVHTALACYLYFSAVQELPGQTIALFSYIDPVSALIFSAIFLGERLGFIQLLGAVLILGGALYGEMADRRLG